MREYRHVACSVCTWQDFYAVRKSYPPRCPDCGQKCEHSFIRVAFPWWARRQLGRDLGVKRIFGDPSVEWKRERDRRWSSSYRSRPQSMYV